MLNKPAGVISATSDKTEKTVIDLLKPPYSKLKLFPVGRLDKDTTGLLILTNDGEFAHNSLSPKKHVQKTYYVEASGHFTPDIAEHFQNGITIDGGYLCKSAELVILNLTDDGITANLTITEGKFHQVKRMFEAEGGHVTALKRIRFGSIKLDTALTEGCYRELTDTEKEYISSLKQEDD
jgi:16S rRNA pseudouridine516 synthase